MRETHTGHGLIGDAAHGAGETMSPMSVSNEELHVDGIDGVAILATEVFDRAWS